MNMGRLFVISAPSGTGKTTILKAVMGNIPGLAFSISHTTRQPRPGEKDGVDYHFISREVFKEMIAKGLFLEHAEVHDNLYGTSSKAVEQQLSEGFDVILDIDVQGADIVRREDNLAATYLFISPPNLSELEKRLVGRGTEDEERITLRLRNAKVEMKAAFNYEYLVINDMLEEAIEMFSAVVLAERARAHRLRNGNKIGEILG